MTPGLKFTRGRASAGGSGGTAVDLSAIRRSEEALNELAARGAAGPELNHGLAHDPALALLGALAADVDTPDTRPYPGYAEPGYVQPEWPGRPVDQRTDAWRALGGAPSQRVAAWLPAAVAGGVVAGLASITSLIVTSMLARLARGPARVGRWPRPARPRRVR